ncbi:uncharacterized protein B0H18DRAFT_344040 [Fomitopsis serialis]|uniref:uncharacterized protein n=1 Tax=Fomitopsis serialis TaxID=139415 RepID=UPI002008E4B7|nr:uncharacterized protein B0H18DRAFT_344040 [Neoantrodia serialis]KAH9926479.1 hypothetical protein B0H18DRAFT_344040 [Neoantrodia serialis]
MHILDLNEDTLSMIISYLSSRDARQLSLVSRGLHLLAKHQALTSVSLYSVEKALKFSIYMLKDMRHRLPMLRELQLKFVILSEEELLHAEYSGRYLSDSAITADAVARLADLLEQASWLKSLALDGAEVWLTYAPRISEALCRMLHLSVIDMDMLYTAVPKFLRGLQSAPRTMILHQTAPSTLPLNPYLDQCTDLCSPSVDCLVVENIATFPSPDDLACMFPNARRLHLCTPPTSAITRLSLVPGWPLLEHVRGSAVLFAQWKLSNPVHLFEVTCAVVTPSKRIPTTSKHRAQVRKAAILALQNVQPVALQAEVDYKLDGMYWSDFLTASHRLRYLSLRLHHVTRLATLERRMLRWWKIVKPLLARRTGVICLKIFCHLHGDRKTADDAPNDPSVAIPQNIVDELQASAVSIPSLLYLSLVIRTSQERQPRISDRGEFQAWHDTHITGDLRCWWQIVHEEGRERVVKTLDVEKGERIAAYMRSTAYDYTKDFDERDVP